MDILTLGSKSSDIKLLCKFLHIPETSVFDNSVELKVKNYQRSAGLFADGIVGYNTWKSLLIQYRNDNHYSDSITDWDYTYFSKLLGCEPAALKAVQEVETGGKGGFLENKKPQILFEGHIFWKELKAIGLNPLNYLENNSNILYQKWDRTKYYGGIREWERFEKASKISFRAAIRSTSWGMFQIMGNNYKNCGCDSVEDFYNKMCKNSFNQFVLGLEFIKRSGLLKYLKNKDWANFAKGYNGSGYKINQYDTKLEKSYKKYK